MLVTSTVACWAVATALILLPCSDRLLGSACHFPTVLARLLLTAIVSLGLATAIFFDTSGIGAWQGSPTQIIEFVLLAGFISMLVSGMIFVAYLSRKWARYCEHRRKGWAEEGERTDCLLNATFLIAGLSLGMLLFATNHAPQVDGKQRGISFAQWLNNNPINAAPGALAAVITVGGGVRAVLVWFLKPRRNGEEDTRP